MEFTVTTSKRTTGSRAGCPSAPRFHQVRQVRPWKERPSCILHLLLLLLIPLLLTACAGGEDTPSRQTPTPGATPSPPPPVSLPENTTTAARIRGRGYVNLGVRYDLQPFGYVNDDGALEGFDVDLGREFARRWLGNEEAVRFRQVRSDTAVEHLQAGDVDLVIAALIHTQDREAGADFSPPYFIDGQALLVRAADADAIQGPASLQGHAVGVVRWSEASEALQNTAPVTLTLQSYDHFDACVAALGQGEVAAVADMRHRLFWGKWIFPEARIVGQYTAAPVALAFPQNDPFFADLVNLTFQQIAADGTYGELYTRWFAPELPPVVERWPGAEAPSLADAPLTTSVPDTIATIQSRGRLIVAVEAQHPPLVFTDESGVITGYEVSLVRQMAQRWLGDPTMVDFTPATLEAGDEMLAAGQADMLIGGLAHTGAAERELDFSLTIYVAGEGLLVRAGTPITDLSSLRGQQVALVEGSSSREALPAAAREAELSLTVLPRPTMEAAVGLLEEGGAIAVAGERIELLEAAYGREDLAVLPWRLTQVPLAIGLPAGDSTFRDLVNLTLQTMKVEGEFDALYFTWFDDASPTMDIWPGTPYRALRLQAAVTE